MLDVRAEGARLTFPGQLRPDGYEVAPGGVFRLAGDACTSYDILAEAPGVHRHFLEVEGLRSAGAFVREFGLLLHVPGTGTIASESYRDDWEPRLVWLRHVRDVFAATAEGQEGALARFVRMPADTVEVQEPNGTWACALRSVVDLPDACRPSLFAAAARHWCNKQMAGALAEVGAWLLDSGSGDGVGWCVSLPSVWAVILWQAGREMAGELSFRQCAACGRWLVETPKMREDPSRTSCSSACRQALYRRRKAAS